MNDNTRRQWDLYQEREVPCPDCAWLLLAFVRDHSEAEGISRPGWRRLHDLTRRSNDWISTHKGHLEAAGHIVLVSPGRWRGRSSAHDAAEYELPWLRGAVDSRSPSLRNRSDKRSDKRSTSSPLRGEQRSGARKDGAPAAAQPGDAADWCGMCEQFVAEDAHCPCEDCDGLVGCRVSPATRRHYELNPDAWRPTPPLQVVPS